MLYYIISYYISAGTSHGHLRAAALGILTQVAAQGAPDIIYHNSNSGITQVALI